MRSATDQIIALGDVAEIRPGAALRRGEATFNAKPAVVLMINKQPDVDTPQLTKAVEQRVEQLNASLPKDVVVSQTFRQAQFIDTAIRNVSESLLLGVVIVAAVLVLFLMNWRTAVILSLIHI